MTKKLKNEFKLYKALFNLIKYESCSLLWIKNSKKLASYNHNKINYAIKKLIANGLIQEAGNLYKITKEYTEKELIDILIYTDAYSKRITKCKECGEQKPLSSTKVKLWRDTEGNFRKRRICNTCILEIENNGFNEPLTHRKCRLCSCALPVSRYFKCYSCVPTLPSDMGDLIYNDGHKPSEMPTLFM